VLSSGIIVESSREAYWSKLAAAQASNAVDVEKQGRCELVEPCAIVNELIGRDEAEIVALLVRRNDGIAFAEQLSQGDQIGFVAP
jgi:hypothetical protein